jgi:hypothetical protein
MRPALAVLALAPLLIGCSIFPLPDDVSRKSTYDIIEKIRCEAKAAVMEFGRGFNDAHIAYEFQFNVDEHNDANVGFSLLDQLKGPGSIKVNGAAQANLLREGGRNIIVQDTFDDLRQLNCSRDMEKNWIYPLTGNIGMYDAVATFIRLQHADNPGPTRVFTFADKLTYITTFTAGANATLKLNPAPVFDEFRFTAANATGSASRMDTHMVTITMTAGQQTIAGPNGRMITRRTVPMVDAGIARFGARRSFRNGDPGVGGIGGAEGIGVAGGFNNVLSTRMLQQDSGAANRALYELDRQRQLELQRRATDVRVLVGP